MSHTAQLLIREVVTVAPSEPVLDVVRLMRNKHIGCVVVAEAGKVAGIFTERDLVTRVVPEELDVRSTPVSKVMTRDPVTVDCAEPLERVFDLLARHRFRHVPITDAGRPAGMVSMSDFAGVLREVFGEGRYIQYFVDYVAHRGEARKG
ncbi:MAG: CBS domain-containing protein [Elusimicrobia bacterium]|nr:CBS domain-containing protein [Elusimicrobiota bacterium]